MHPRKNISYWIEEVLILVFLITVDQKPGLEKPSASWEAWDGMLDTSSKVTESNAISQASFDSTDEIYTQRDSILELVVITVNIMNPPHTIIL